MPKLEFLQQSSALGYALLFGPGPLRVVQQPAAKEPTADRAAAQ